MVNLLSSLVNNLTERIHEIKCKYGHNDNKCETLKIKQKDFDCFLENKNFKDDLIEYKCLYWNKKEIFCNTCKFSNHNIYKFILLLRKGVYPYGYMDDLKKFNDSSFPEKEDF